MAKSPNSINIYLEIGKKRTFAGALDWPGWCRNGRDEESAIQALFEYGRRYARVLRGTRLGFQMPRAVSEFIVIERLNGNATTDFGAPAIAPASDSKPVGDAELKRLQRLLKASWRTFDDAIEAASGKTLRLGPRGGGRDVKSIIQHILGSDEGYLSSVGWKLEKVKENDLDQQLNRAREAVLNALASSAKGEIPARGPRGGMRWSARFFTRRLAWHVLDHAWEIEDRLL